MDIHEASTIYSLIGKLINLWIFQVIAGDFFHIPRETVHSFRNGLALSRLLATFSPAGIEGFFREIGKPVEDRLESPPPVTEETIARLLAAEAAGWKQHHDTLPLG